MAAVDDPGAEEHGPRERRFLGWPATPPGWFAAGFFSAAVALFAFMNVLVAVFHQEGGETLADNLWLAIPGLGGAACAIAGGGAALFAIGRRGERSGLVFVAGLVGLMVAWFVAGEVLNPH